MASTPAVYQNQTHAIHANGYVDLHGDWDYFLLVSATAPDNVEIGFGNDGFQPLVNGIAIGGLRALGVKTIRLHDTSGAPNTVVISTGGASVSLSNSTALSPGASTAALQTAGNALLTSIDTKLTSVGYTTSTLDAAGTANATLLKATAGMVYEVSAVNNAAYDVFIKMVNKATAAVPGTDIPYRVLRVPAGQTAQLIYPNGAYFDTGITYFTSKLVAKLDATALAAGDVQLSVQWA